MRRASRKQFSGNSGRGLEGDEELTRFIPRPTMSGGNRDDDRKFIRETVAPAISILTSRSKSDRLFAHGRQPGLLKTESVEGRQTAYEEGQV